MSRMPSGKKCMVSGCENMVKANDLCALHYQRSLRHGHTDGTRHRRLTCAVDGCDRAHVAKGLCQMHYYRLQRTGTTNDPAHARAVCEIDGCGEPVVSHGLCDKHRKRVERHGTVIETRPADWGSREKHPLYGTWIDLMRHKRSITDARWHDLWVFVEDIGDSRPSPDHVLARKDDTQPFGSGNVYWREPRSSGNSPEVKAQRAAYMRGWYKANTDKVTDGELRKRYGITLADYNRMYEEQDGLCAICRREEARVDHRSRKVSRFAVDHDHETSAVRGLLCHRCNNGLGTFDDDLGVMRAAILYVERHQAAHAAEPRTPAINGSPRDYLDISMAADWPPPVGTA